MEKKPHLEKWLSNGQAAKAKEALVDTLLRPWHPHMHALKAMIAPIGKPSWQKHIVKIKAAPKGQAYMAKARSQGQGNP